MSQKQRLIMRRAVVYVGLATFARTQLTYVNVEGREYGFFPDTINSLGRCRQFELSELLDCVANNEKQVVVTAVDFSMFDQLVNFWETSIQGIGMDNLLVFCTSTRCFDACRTIGLPVFRLHYDTVSDEESAFRGREYSIKTHAKMDAVYRVLNEGYSPLLTDVDVIMFKPPWNLFNRPNCDITCEQDTRLLNSGFYYTTPTKGTIAFHRRSLDRAHLQPKTSSQLTMNRILRETQLEDINKRCNSGQKPLHLCKAPNLEIGDGRLLQYYFSQAPGWELPQVLHNCFIFGVRSKIFREKFAGWWKADVNREYSEPPRNFLMVRFPAPISLRDVEWNVTMTHALNAAAELAKMMDRDLILPREIYYDGSWQYYDAKWKGSTEYLKGGTGVWRPLVQVYEPGFLMTVGREWRVLAHPKMSKYYKQGLSKLIRITDVQPDAVFFETTENNDLLNRHDNWTDPQTDAMKNKPDRLTLDQLKQVADALRAEYGSAPVLQLDNLYVHVKNVSKVFLRRRAVSPIASEHYPLHDLSESKHCF